jgi:site-specific recombinase XerD
VPYIVTQEELRRILDATKSFTHPLLQSETLRSVLLILYGAGLRISEALALKLEDVQLAVPLLRINDSKFYKSRLVPLGSQLRLAMAKYAKWRKDAGYSQDKTSPFFVLRDGSPVNQTRVRGAFERLRRDLRLDRAGQRPRLHDLRHSFAVHRLLQWYRQGADVQRLLPKLSVYLGHVRLSCTQAYLSMTPDLLREANARFERYVSQGVDHEEW